MGTVRIKRNPASIERIRNVYVPGDGEIPNDFLGLGQGPGFQEAASRVPKPWIGPAGEELDNAYLRQAGFNRSKVYLTNAYPHFICDAKGSDRVPTVSELESHWPTLEREIATVNPKVIACLGGVATRWMMNRAGLEYRGIDSHHGLPVGYYNGALLFATEHPARGIHATDSMKDILADFIKLKSVYDAVKRGDTIHFPVDIYAGIEDYRELSTPQEVHRALTNIPNPPYIGIDTEGSAADPIFVQFSIAPGSGYAIRSECHRALAVLADYLASCPSRSCIILLWNALYDLSVLRSLNIPIPDGSFIDLMVCQFELCVEPQGLKPSSWRLNGMKMQSYEEQIGDRSQEMAICYLLDAACHTWPEAEQRIIREGVNFRLNKPWAISRYIEKLIKDYSEQYEKLDHTSHIEIDETLKSGEIKRKKHTHDWWLKRHDGKCPPGCVMVQQEEREEPLDLVRRWYNIDPEVRKPVEEILGPLPNATLRDVDVSRALSYSCRDSDATVRNGPPILKRIHEMGLDLTMQIDHGALPIMDRMQYIGIAADANHFRRLGLEWQDQMDQLQYQLWEMTGENINPGSGDQVAALLFDKMGLPSDRWTKSRVRLATDKKALEPLRFVHPVVPILLEWSELQTLKDNFANILPAKIKEDGRVHTTIRGTRVPSGRMATTNPNLLAQPTRSETGQEIREGFHAGPGHLLVSIDESQVELRGEAHLSRDKKLVAVFNEGRDAHSDTGAWMEHVSYEEFECRRKEGTPDEQKRAKDKRTAGKTINFGLVNLITGVGLLDQFKLQDLASNEWRRATPYAGPTIDKKGKLKFATCQNITGDPHRFIALGGGKSGWKEPRWDFTPSANTHDGEIEWQEIGEGWTVDKGNQFIAGWMENYSGVPVWHENLFAEARRTGMVRSLTGGIRYCPEINSTISRISEAGKKQIVNYPIQRFNVEMMKIWMAMIWDRIVNYYWPMGIYIEPLLCVHDELLMEMDDWIVEVVVEDFQNLLAVEVPKKLAGWGIELVVPLGSGWGKGATWAGIEKS